MTVRFIDDPERVRRYQKQYLYDKLHGRRRTIDATPVREHARILVEFGMNAATIAAAAGLSDQAISLILRGQRTTKVTTARKILAVQPHIPTKGCRGTPSPKVPARGARRRIQALYVLGWRMKDIVEAGGLQCRPQIRANDKHIARNIHDGIARAYRELSGREGSCEHTRSMARNQGYFSPAHWDDIDLDPEPECAPVVKIRLRDQPIDEVVVERILGGDYSLAPTATKAERIEVTRRWRADGRSLSSLEAETGWRPDRYRTPADVRRIIERSLAS